MDYLSIKAHALKHINETSLVDCPALGQVVKIDKQGFKHVIFMKGRHVRDRKSQNTRFKLIPLAIESIKSTTKIDNYRIESVDNIDYQYWSFDENIQNKRFRVVLRKVGNGSIHFWSVIPKFESKRKTRSFTKKNINFN